MSVFWKSRYLIAPGYGMGSYSIGHFLWLALMLLSIILLGSSYRKGNEKRRRGIRNTVALLIIMDEVLKDVVMPLTGQWDWSFLPLHLCSISVFAVAFHAVTESRLLAEYLYAVTLPTALMAMVFPDWTGTLPLWNFLSIHSFSIHLLLVLYPCLLIYGGFKPSVRYLIRIIPAVLCLAFIMHFVNNELGTNFFFVNGGGDGVNPLSVLEDYAGRFYLLALPVIAAICWLPMYLIPRRVNKDRQ